MTLRRAWPHVAIVAVATLLVLLLKLPLSRLDVPYTFEGDALDKLAQIKTVAETGWLFHNDRLGYPFGYDRLDFPRFDSLNYVVLGPLAALTSSGVAMNVYYLAGFYLIAFAAFFCLRRLGLATLPALLSSLLYAFLPYHVIRGVAHLTNGAYFLVPPAMLVLIELARDRLGSDTPAARRGWLFALAIAVLLPLQMPYNGFFFAYLAVVATAIALAMRARWRPVLVAVSLTAATAGAFVAEGAPVWLHAMRYGDGTIGIDRSPVAAELLSLRLNQVVLPTSADRRRPLAVAKRDFDLTMGAPIAENRNQYIGVLGVFGLAALAWSLMRAARVRAIAGDDDAETETSVRISALLAIAVLLLAMPTGLDTLIAYGLTPMVRAYNRVLPFLAFPCLFGAGWLLQTTLVRPRAGWLRGVAFAVIAVVALLDIVVRPPFGRRIQQVEQYDRARDYFGGVERTLDRGAAVFQLPAAWYPEHPPINDMGDYEEFMPFLLTDHLRFSYGVAHARVGYGWSKFVEGLPAREMIDNTHAMGFAAILVDGDGYAKDARKTLTDALAAALPKPPLVSDDQRWWLFALDGCCGAPVAPLTPGRAPTAFDYRPADGPLRFSAGGNGILYTAGGWQDPEPWGMWQSGERSRLRMRLVPAPNGPIAITLETTMLLGPNVQKRSLRIDGNGRDLGDFVYEQASQSLRIDVPSGVIGADGVVELTFKVTGHATPKSAGLGEDQRPLGVGLITLTVEPATDRAP